MGVLFDCPELARRLPEKPSAIWRGTRITSNSMGNRLGWVTARGTSKCATTRSPRPALEAHQGPVLSWLPIEGLL